MYKRILSQSTIGIVRPFEVTRLNIGEAMDAKGGIFTAPKMAFISLTFQAWDVFPHRLT